MDAGQPQLKNKQQFIDALAKYEPSDRVRQVLSTTPFVVLCGLAGGGRNTVIRYLVAHYNYGFDISDTTRPPKLRDGSMEQNGINYYFRSEEEMLRDIENGDFIEAEIIHDQQVSGISIREVERVVAMGHIPIRDIEYGGAASIVSVKPDASIITLLPPSYDEWMRRLRGREAIRDEEFYNRLRTAEKVLERTLELSYFRIVINADIEQCAEDIRAIVENGSYSTDDEALRRAIAKEILDNVKLELQAHGQVSSVVDNVEP